MQSHNRRFTKYAKGLFFTNAEKVLIGKITITI